MIRQLQSTPFDSKGYTDENSLAKLMLSQPDYVSRKLTYLLGQDESDNYGFLMMTEGNGQIKENTGDVATLNNVEFIWDAMERLKFTSEVVRLSSVGVGAGLTPFTVVFKDNWFISQYGALAPDGVTQVQIHGEPTPVHDGYEYTFELKTTDLTAVCDMANLLPGKFWIMTAPSIPESGSRGNRSNVQGTMRYTNQIGFKRYSKIIEGNLANKVVPIQFDGSDTKDGKPTSLWINEEMRQFEVAMRTLNNQDLYLSEYNRDVNGQIFLKDYDNGKPIPLNAGAREQIMSSGNSDVYGLNLTAAKLKGTVGDVFWGESDSKKMEIVLHGGQGFLEDFNDAITNDMAGKGFIFNFDKFTGSGKDGYLSYGNYFNVYRTVTGHSIVAKHETMFDTGLLGQLDKANGNLHPITGYPMSSHTGVFVDYSTYGGERNVKLATMKGQSYINGVVKGLSPIPASWGALPEKFFSNDKDESRYEVKMARGLHMGTTNHCFILQSSR